MMKFLKRTRDITLADLAGGQNIDYLFRNTAEELGEFAAARTIEEGSKNKPLKESSRQEAVDVVICALSLFYASGGTNEELAVYGQEKLNKWESRLTPPPDFRSVKPTYRPELGDQNMSELREEQATNISGFGDNVVVLKDIDGGTICYIGQQDNQEKILFIKPVTSETMDAVSTLLKKRKMRKALNEQKYDKAQNFADRKFNNSW